MNVNRAGMWQSGTAEAQDVSVEAKKVEQSTS